jgi:hypothetical protein
MMLAAYGLAFASAASGLHISARLTAAHISRCSVLLSVFIG